MKKFQRACGYVDDLKQQCACQLTIQYTGITKKTIRFKKRYHQLLRVITECDNRKDNQCVKILIFWDSLPKLWYLANLASFMINSDRHNFDVIFLIYICIKFETCMTIAVVLVSLWMGILSQCVTNQPGQLSLAFLWLG